MTGLRVLDVGTYDGFFAFECERRGADVVAIDIHPEDCRCLLPRKGYSAAACRTTRCRSTISARTCSEGGSTSCSFLASTIPHNSSSAIAGSSRERRALFNSVATALHGAVITILSHRMLRTRVERSFSGHAIFLLYQHIRRRTDSLATVAKILPRPDFEGAA